MKVFIKIIGISMLATIFLVACGESTVEQVESESAEEGTENNQGSGETSNQEDQQNPENSEEQTSETFDVGDTIKFDQLEITLTNVRVVQDDFLEPENGKFLAIELDIKNTGEEPAVISTMLNMSLLTSDGYQQDQALVDTKGSLDGEIGAGRNLKGEIAFDVEEAEFYEFIFEDPFTSGQAIWKIESTDIQ